MTADRRMATGKDRPAQAAASARPAARVLVVDDENSISMLVSTVLRYEGFDVATAAEGRAALTLAESFHPVELPLHAATHPSGDRPAATRPARV